MNARTTIVDQIARVLPGTGKRAAADRGPVRQIRCLLPVWGYSYIKKFLDVALPTWLAEGNLPALVKTLPTEFVLLTSREDELYLRSHPAFKRLQAVCPTTVHYVDHLITGNNYSTTITLAYTEAVRECGEDMLDTCFFFLVSDYIIADGSFRSVIERVQSGKNGILVGNFQVVEEEALPWLVAQRQNNSDTMTLKPREMMHWALSNLHPATVANTVNYPMNHNDHTNRLFWRVDNQTLIGRFFLMHMIAIRPELTDFVIGSSCDYSFIPEMCPSNNVDIITDSDDYLVIEMQPRFHEAKYLKAGPHKVPKLAKVLSEWTTARHRENSATTVIYHAAEIPQAKTKSTITLADRFLARVRKQLKRRPKPHRRHPYWTGAIAAFHEASGATLTQEEWRLALGLANPELDENYLAQWTQEQLRFAMFGRPPHVRPWHPRYPDHRLVLKNLTALGLKQNSRILMISDGPTIFSATFIDGGERVVRLRSSHMIKQPYEVYEPLHGRFDAALIELEEREFSTADELLDRVAPMMKDGATVLVSLQNKRNGDETQEFQRSIGYHASRLLRPYSKTALFSFVTATQLRARTTNTMMSIAKLAQTNPMAGVPSLLLLGLPLSATTGFVNMTTSVRRTIPPKGYVSSVLITLTVDAECAKDAYRYSNSRILRERQLVRLGYPEGTVLPPRDDVGKPPPSRYLLSGRPNDAPARQIAAKKAPITPEPVKASTDTTNGETAQATPRAASASEVERTSDKGEVAEIVVLDSSAARSKETLTKATPRKQKRDRTRNEQGR